MHIHIWISHIDPSAWYLFNLGYTDQRSTCGCKSSWKQSATTCWENYPGKLRWIGFSSSAVEIFCQLLILMQATGRKHLIAMRRKSSCQTVNICERSWSWSTILLKATSAANRFVRVHTGTMLESSNLTGRIHPDSVECWPSALMNQRRGLTAFARGTCLLFFLHGV